MLRLAQKTKSHDGIAWCCSWSPDGEYLATCGQDKRIKIWKLVDDKLELVDSGVRSSEIHTRTIRRIAWRGDSRFLAAASFDSTVTLWEFNPSDAKLKYITKLSGQESEVKGVCFSPCGDMLATCSRDKSIWIFDVTRLHPATIKDISGFNSVSMSDIPESSEFTFPEDDSVTGGDEPGDSLDIECLAVLQGHSQDVKNITFDPKDSQIIVSVSYDDSIKIWKCSNMHDDWSLNETLRHSNTVWDVAFNPAGGSEFVSASADGTIKLWKAKNACDSRIGTSWMLSGPIGAAARYQSMQQVDRTDSSKWTCALTVQVTLSLDDENLIPVAPVYSVSWSSDGSFLAAVCGDNTVRVFRRTAVSLLQLTSIKLDYEPNCVSFHPRSTRSLAVVCDDGSLHIFNLMATDDFQWV